MGFLFFPIVILVAIFVLGGLRVVDQYERGVVLTLGRYTSTRQPGLTWIFPGIQRMVKTDLRIQTVDVPQQEAITKDNVPVGINGVVYFNVENAESAVLNIQDFVYATAQYAQAALRDTVGGIELDVLLSERGKVAEQIKAIVDEKTKQWGINVVDVKMQDLELPADMKRTMAKQAEAERERRAVVIRAEGELTASENLKKAAENISSAPGGLTLRTLQTVEKINPDPSKTVLFLFPIELIDGLKNLLKKN